MDVPPLHMKVNCKCIYYIYALISCTTWNSGCYCDHVMKTRACNVSHIQYTFTYTYSYSSHIDHLIYSITLDSSTPKPTADDAVSPNVKLL